MSGLPPTGDPEIEAGRAAILACIQEACGAPIAEALVLQAKLSAAFMVSDACRSGVARADCAKTMRV